MPSPNLLTLPPNSVAAAAGGIAGPPRWDREAEWLRVYGRILAMLPRVEALAAGRARLEAINALQHEFWEARDALLQRRLLQAEESRRRWEAAYIALQPSGDDRRFAELQESDKEDLTTFVDVLAAENTEFQIKVKQVDAGAEHSQHPADHKRITEDLKAELRKLQHAYEALCSEKGKKVSEITAERDFLRYQFRTLERENADLLTNMKKEATRATEARQELQQNVEQLQMLSQKKDNEIRKLQAQAIAKRAEAKKELVPKETRNCSSKQMLGEDGQPGPSQKRKCATFVSNNDGQNGNDEETHKQVLEPLKKKTVAGKGGVDQEDNRAKLTDGKSHSESNRSPHKLAIYNALLYLRSVKDSFADKPEKHKEFLAIQSEFVSRKIDADAFISAIKVLLDGHPELIRGFKSCFTSTLTQVLGSTGAKC